VFFVQSAGSPDAGTGLEKSSIIQKISLADAEAMRNGSHTQSEVEINIVNSEPQISNPNGYILVNIFPCWFTDHVQAEPTIKARSSLLARVKERTFLQPFT
jgi:hypothetical protein